MPEGHHTPRPDRQPSDIATTAVFFASSDSGWATGQTLILAGGARQ
ncbi:hypothetical protein [Granulicella sibirica]|uniref:3-oxoacyl-[acyl-carrier protein] reductase n=1 Tax=Granulicella sibirica TaxID=2479048 RepID=A0A4Q0T2I7_9BACT|nr:hypothetical protein [Granulicella sibirica]RXH55781.1 hypothetical protein GRAN_2638 [Granulicella sibirica]